MRAWGAYKPTRGAHIIAPSVDLHPPAGVLQGGPCRQIVPKHTNKSLLQADKSLLRADKSLLRADK
eukprot:4667261-Pyramimonas_sp.AAC.1